MRALLVVLGLLATLGGCGEDDGGDKYGLCQILIDCNATQMSMGQCGLYFNALVLAPTCVSTIKAATCEDHKQETPSYFDVCFPPCTGTSAVCDGDVITACSNDRTMVGDCVNGCLANGKHYTGVCANEYQGQPSSTGQDQCWCE